VDDIVAVSEEAIEEAVRVVANDAKLIAEPSSCVGIAALQSGLVDTRPDEKVCVVLTSGNWDLDMIGSLLKGEHVKGIF
jgi:threonine dehydratase